MFLSLLRFQKPTTILQVGAYLGDDALIEICRQRNHHLYMFEPNPNRVADLERKANGAPTIHVIPKAVSNYNGKATFHIACYDDCSSLQEFDGNANTTWVHEWHPYKRFEMVKHLEVDVIRLDTFLDQQGIQTVELLEIDAQGEDLRVVESLDRRIADVKNIQIEVNISGNPLYRNSFTMPEAKTFFDAYQFERHVAWKQCLNREENVIFRNRRFYPNAFVNRCSATLEQNWRAAYFTAVKLPRVLAVTGTMLRRKFTRSAA